jgi:hypothetical protein
LNHSVYNDENIYHCKGIRNFNCKSSQQKKKKITAIEIRIAEPVVGLTLFFSIICMNEPTQQQLARITKNIYYWKA